VLWFSMPVRTKYVKQRITIWLRYAKVAFISVVQRAIFFCDVGKKLKFLFVLLKVPKWEIFDLLESRDFYTMKPSWEGVFRYAHDFEVCSAKC